MKSKQTIKYYKKIYKEYKIICNNSVNGGDCLGETYCGELKFHKPSNRMIYDLQCNHKDFFCQECKILVCNCCYKHCPSCTD